MSKTVTGIIALIAGLLIGGVGGTSLLGGAMMGAGVGTGLSAGMCSTAQAGQALGYLTDVQVDEVIKRAAEDVSGKPLAEGETVVGGSAACRDVMEKLEQQTSK